MNIPLRNQRSAPWKITARTDVRIVESDDSDDMSRWRYRVAIFRFWGILFSKKNSIVGKESENTTGHGMKIGIRTDQQHKSLKKRIKYYPKGEVFSENGKIRKTSHTSHTINREVVKNCCF